MSKVLNFIHFHRKSNTFILIMFGVLAPLVYVKIRRDPNISFSEQWYYMSQIVTSIYVITGVVVAGWQYYLASSDSRRNLQITQYQKAIDLSEYYKDNILHYLPAIRYVFTESGALEDLKSITLDKMKLFNHRELQQILTEKQIQKLKDLQKNPKFIRGIIEANDIYGLKFVLHTKFVEIEDENGNKKKTISLNQDAIVIAFMSSIIMRTLNNMEFFAMHFNTNVADDSVVYQSLHQTYLELMPLVYYYIANQNVSEADKFYTNAIWLFHKWKKMTDERNEQAQAAYDLTDKRLD